MVLSQKTKDNKKKSHKQSPTGMIIILILFFFIIPAVPIILALISEQSTTNHIETSCKIAFTAEGKVLFQGKEDLFHKYLVAAKEYNVPWEYLAAIHKNESNFADTSSPKLGQQITNDTPIQAIKVGPMGFLEINWIAQSELQTNFFTDYPTARTLLSDQGDLNNSLYATLIDPQVIKKYKGIGIDANGDQKADPYNIDDAIYTVAKVLKATGMDEGKIKQALTSFNSELGYADKIKDTAQEIASKVIIQACSEQVPTGSMKSMIDHAYQIYQNRTINYIFGADSYPNFDCSSWVKYMYKKHLGIQLMRTTHYQVQQGTYVPRDQLQPGDLIFFARGSDVYHVGMYVGDGMMIHNANSRLDMKLDTIDRGYYKNNYHSGRRYTKADSI